MDGEEKDRISMLPDEVIEVILSRLSIFAAIRTSILSSRWRHIWRYFSGSLRFDGYFVLNVLLRMNGDKLLPEERKGFIKWVSQVLQSIQSPTLEGLRICFDMTDDSSEVDAWVQFAIQKQVKKLDLQLYTLPVNGHHIIDSLLLNFTSLTSLRLKHVDVSGESLEHLLSSCPCLEELAVAYSSSLLSLKVSTPSLKLKRLQIVGCFDLKTLEVDAKSLVSFAYTGRHLNAVYKNLPSLVELFLGSYALNLADFHLLFPYLSQIKVLKLEFCIYLCPSHPPPNFSKLANVQHLQMSLSAPYFERDGIIKSCIPVINACSSLSILTLLITYTRRSFETEAEFDVKHSYDFLKEVQVVGFTGCSVEVEFIMYIVKNASNLRKLIIDTIHPTYWGISWEKRIRETLELDSSMVRARERASDMKPRIPVGVEFVIL